MQTNDHDEVRAARAALIALRSALHPEDLPETGYYVLLPSLEYLTADDMAAHLAALPKPTMCVASRIDLAVAVACWRPIGNAKSDIDAIRDLRRATARRDRTVADEMLVLRGFHVVSHEEEMLLSRGLFWRVVDEYIVLNVNFTISDPDDKARASGASGVVRFLRQPNSIAGTLSRNAKGEIESITIRRRPPGPAS
jgi:hypothetical protein